MKRFFETMTCEKTDLKILSLRIQETDSCYRVSILAPGQSASDISISITGNKVTVTNEKEDQHPLQDHIFSFSYFRRTFTTLHEIEKDGVKLSCKNHFIHLILPKKQRKGMNAACRDLPPLKSSSHPVIFNM